MLVHNTDAEQAITVREQKLDTQIMHSSLSAAADRIAFLDFIAAIRPGIGVKGEYACWCLAMQMGIRHIPCPNNRHRKKWVILDGVASTTDISSLALENGHALDNNEESCDREIVRDLKHFFRSQLLTADEVKKHVSVLL